MSVETKERNCSTRDAEIIADIVLAVVDKNGKVSKPRLRSVRGTITARSGSPSFVILVGEMRDLES
jgi:hypothetical protein